MRARISLACVLVFFSSAAVYADGYVAPKALGGWRGRHLTGIERRLGTAVRVTKAKILAPRGGRWAASQVRATLRTLR